MKVLSLASRAWDCSFHHGRFEIGTVFSAPFVGPNSLNEWLIANFTPSVLHPSGQLGLVRAVKTLLRLYPDSLGSPYKAGLDNFGLHSAYKRISAIRWVFFLKKNWVKNT
jgi:hypothetical protein